MNQNMHVPNVEIPPQTPADDARVSALSIFSDKKWDFTSENGNAAQSISDKIINWETTIINGLTLSEPVYSTILISLKQLAYALLFQVKPRKITTVVRAIKRLILFVRFLGNREHPIYRFQDVLESDVNAYIKNLKNQPSVNGKISPRTLTTYLVVLNMLFDYSYFLTDHLRIRPTKNKRPSQVAGVKAVSRSETLPIPDNELKALIDICLQYIQVKSQRMFTCLDEFNLFVRNIGFDKLKRGEKKSKYINKHFFSQRDDYKSASDLNRELIRLRTACFTIIAFCTGMRISEVMAMKRDCVHEQLDANHGTFYWIDSLLFKTQKSNAGAARSWMCGRIAAEAVQVLERLGELLGAHKYTDYLIFSFTHFVMLDRPVNRQIKILTERWAASQLKLFCAFHNLDNTIHTHRLRRSFARNIIRYSSTPIVALKEHFKHWSLYMTDWYIGLDSELIELLEAERLVLSFEAMEKICTQPIGGAGGRRWTKELERRIADGKLPRTFRGKAGAEFRKEMITSVHNSGMIATPCGDFTYCVFQREHALCTDGDKPLPNKCNPYDCSNSYILPEHVPAHQRKLVQIKGLFKKLPEEERGGPAGLFYSREIRKIEKNLEPFSAN